MSFFNLLGVVGAMTAGFIAWVIIFAWGLHGTEFAAICSFFTAVFGSIADRVLAGRALKAYLHPFNNPVEPHENPRVQISLLGIPLIITPYFVLAASAVIGSLSKSLPLSGRFVEAMLISCGASLTVTLATVPIRSIRSLDS